MRFLTVVAVCLLLARVAGAADVKFGIVDYAKVYRESKVYKKNSATWEADITKEREILDKQEKDLADMKKTFEKQLPILTEEQKTKKANEIRDREKALDTAREAAAERIKARREKLVEECHATVRGIIDRYAKAKSFTCIFESNIVLSPGTCIDVTKDILEEVAK